MENLTDVQLVELLSEGNRVAWNEFIRRFKNPIWRVIRSMLRGRRAAGMDEHDFYQCILMHLLEKNCRRIAHWRRDAVGNVGKLEHYICTVARNKTEDIFREHAGVGNHERPEDPNNDIENTVPDENLGPVGLLQVTQEEEGLEHAVRTLLTNMQQKVIEKIRMGKSDAKIATELGIAVGTVHTHKNRAVARLRNFYFNGGPL